MVIGSRKDSLALSKGRMAKGESCRVSKDKVNSGEDTRGVSMCACRVREVFVTSWAFGARPFKSREV